MITEQLHGNSRTVVACLLRIWDELSARFPTPRHAQAPCRARFERTVRFLMQEAKLGAAFIIRAGRCRAMLIFANSEYQTPWDWSKVVTDLGQGVDERIFDELCRDNGMKLRNVAFTACWASHYTLCCVEQPRGCCATPWEQYVPLMQAAAESHPLPDVDLILNRRDCPVFRRSGEHCYAFASSTCRVPKSSNFLPALSVYQGAGWSDLPVIEPDIPKQAKGTRWELKKEVALFRGAATGPGVTNSTNTRLAVANIESEGLIDAGITSHPKRFKIEDGVLYRPLIGRTVKPVPASDWSCWKYLIYVDGHSAALRYGSMMSCKSVILKVDPVLSRADDAHGLWFFPKLYGVRFGGEALVGDVERADHIKVSVAHLHDCVVYLLKHDDLARAIATRSNDFFLNELSPAKRAKALAEQVCAAAKS